MIIINEERNYRKLKENVRVVNSQRSDTEKFNLIEECKKIGIDELLNAMKLLIISLKHKTSS